MEAHLLEPYEIGDSKKGQKFTTIDQLKEKASEDIGSYRLASISIYISKNDIPCGISACYEHFDDKSKKFESNLIGGSACSLDTPKETMYFEDGEYVVAIEGCYTNYICRLFILTSEGQYMEIGKNIEGGSEFQWYFKKEKYLIAFQAIFEEYLTYCAPISCDVQHTKFKVKEKVPKLVNVSADNVTKPNLIYKTVEMSKGKSGYYFDDMFEYRLQEAIATGNFRINKVECWFNANSIFALAVSYSTDQKKIKALHSCYKEEKLEKYSYKELSIEDNDYIAELYCAFPIDTLRYLSLKTKSGKTLNVGNARETEITAVLNSVKFKGRLLAIYGSHAENGILSLGVYYDITNEGGDEEKGEEELKEAKGIRKGN